MHTVFLSGNECTVSKWEFVFDGADSKASSITEKFKSVFSLILNMRVRQLRAAHKKINSERLRTVGYQCIYVDMAQWTVKPDLLTCPKC